MITFDVKPISLEVALSTYIQEGVVSFLCDPFCNSDCPIKTEIRQFSGVSHSCPQMDALLRSLSALLVVSVVPPQETYI